METDRMVTFTLAGMVFDYDRIEFYDEEHSDEEERFDTIGDTSAGTLGSNNSGTIIGNIDQSIGKVNEILFVVYTERIRMETNGVKTDVICPTNGQKRKWRDTGNSTNPVPYLYQLMVQI